MEQEYLEVNRALWNAKTPIHMASAFYDMEGFAAGKQTLKAPELALLGDVRGKRILHLQCHFGQDSLSLARMGAVVTGVDFSDAAIAAARELNERLGLDAQFVCKDIYSLEDDAPGAYDMVFTTYGTIGWLPDVARWARVIARHLRPGGAFVFADFHPVVWMYNSDWSRVIYSYFNKESIVETNEGTYADKNAALNAKEIGWNHSLSEVFQGLSDAGVRVERFAEYDYSPYNCLAGMVETGADRYEIGGLEGKLPLVYSVLGVRE